MQSTINLGGNSFAGTVDGKSTSAAPNAPSLNGAWGLYGTYSGYELVRFGNSACLSTILGNVIAKWLPKWLDTISTAADSAGMGSQHIQLRKSCPQFFITGRATDRIYHTLKPTQIQLDDYYTACEPPYDVVWVKHALAQNSPTFWTSGSSSNQSGAASPSIQSTTGTTLLPIPPSQPSSVGVPNTTPSTTNYYDSFWIWSIVLLFFVLSILAAIYLWRRRRRELEEKDAHGSETTQRKSKRERKKFFRHGRFLRPLSPCIGGTR